MPHLEFLIIVCICLLSIYDLCTAFILQVALATAANPFVRKLALSLPSPSATHPFLLLPLYTKDLALMAELSILPVQSHFMPDFSGGRALHNPELFRANTAEWVSLCVCVSVLAVCMCVVKLIIVENGFSTRYT